MKRFSLIILAGVALAACSPAPEKPVATIGIVTDIHYCRDREPGGSRYYALSKAKLAEAVDVFNEQGVDFTFPLVIPSIPIPTHIRTLPMNSQGSMHRFTRSLATTTA